MSKETIHWTGTPQGICVRLDTNADIGPIVTYADGATSQSLGIASHRENVPCKICRRFAYPNQYSLHGERTGGR